VGKTEPLGEVIDHNTESVFAALKSFVSTAVLIYISFDFVEFTDNPSLKSFLTGYIKDFLSLSAFTVDQTD